MGTFYGPKTVTDGLALYADAGNIKSYPGTGNTWYDISYNSLNLTGTAGWITPAGGATSGQVWATSSTSILNTNIHSIFFYIKFNSSVNHPQGTTGNWDKIFTYAGGGSDRSPGVWRYPSSRWIHWRYDPSNTGCDFGVNSTTLDSNSEFPLNTWYYVGVTKNGANTVMYVNGREIGTSTVSNPKTAGNAAVQIYESYAPGAPSLSNLNNLAIYNRVITGAEVLQNYNATKGRFGL